MFSKELSNLLNTYNQIKHFINLMKNKMSRTKCVYNMSQDKLITIQKYIAETLKKMNSFF